MLILTNETTSPDDIILCTATVQDDDGDADSAVLLSSLGIGFCDPWR